MKFLLALFLCGISLAVCKEDRQCRHKDDCDAGECCVQVNCITPSRCKRLRKEGEWCFPSSSILSGKQPYYRFVCPCAEGARCEVYSTERAINDKLVYNYKCQP